MPHPAKLTTWWSFLILSLLCATSILNAKTNYAGNLEYILGDVKQGQITNALNTKTKIDNVLDGFEKLGCNGVRITIFPEGNNPNPALFDYLYTESKKRGFKIFANPAQHAGAQRVANKDIENTAPVKNDRKATSVLINHIKDFSRRYPCDWINPFNEDGAVDGAWSKAQINEIYGDLYKRINGAEMIGPCTWGIPAGINMLRNSDITDFITVATTHNLGHNHGSWNEFIKVAKSHNLPVWDSEVNTHKKFENKPHRLHAALDAGVDGLVLYHAWTSYVNPKTGELTPLGVKVRDLILENPEEHSQNISTKESKVAPPVQKTPNYLPQEGDLLFQSIPYNTYIDTIEGSAQSPYSHCGILIIKDGQWMVLESLNAVTVTPINDWRDRAQFIDVYRFKEPFRKHIPKMIDQAQRFTGQAYDIYYQMDDSRIYGAELIYKAYKITSGRNLGKTVSLSDFVQKDRKKLFFSLNRFLPLEREIITAYNLSKSTDLEKVYSSKP